MSSTQLAATNHNKALAATLANALPPEEYVASDVLIPRLLLMQGLSPLVTSRKAQLGDIVRSTTQEKLGNPEKPVELVPIKLIPSWINFEVVGQKAEYRGQEPRNSKNERLEWEYEKDGAQWQRRKAYTLYALVPADVAKYEAELAKAEKTGEAPDLNRTVLPVVLTFQSTSFKHAGKKIASFFNNVAVNAKRVKGLMPYQYILTLTCREEKNNKGTYYVWDAMPPKTLTDAAIKAEAGRWAQVLGSTQVKVDDGELEAEGDSSESMDV